MLIQVLFQTLRGSEFFWFNKQWLGILGHVDDFLVVVSTNCQLLTTDTLHMHISSLLIYIYTNDAYKQFSMKFILLGLKYEYLL